MGRYPRGPGTTALSTAKPPANTGHRRSPRASPYRCRPHGLGPGQVAAARRDHGCQTASASSAARFPLPPRPPQNRPTAPQSPSWPPGLTSSPLTAGPPTYASSATAVRVAPGNFIKEPHLSCLPLVHQQKAQGPSSRRGVRAGGGAVRCLRRGFTMVGPPAGRKAVERLSGGAARSTASFRAAPAVLRVLCAPAGQAHSSRTARMTRSTSWSVIAGKHGRESWRAAALSVTGSGRWTMSW